jgi:hypothetical protein
LWTDCGRSTGIWAVLNVDILAVREALLTGRSVHAVCSPFIKYKIYTASNRPLLSEVSPSIKMMRAEVENDAGKVNEEV